MEHTSEAAVVFIQSSQLPEVIISIYPALSRSAVDNLLQKIIAAVGCFFISKCAV